jgi:hypothetical protein
MLDGGTEIRLLDWFAEWRRTHGYAEDEAKAVVLAVLNARSAARVYNIGERVAPAWAERITKLFESRIIQ